VTKADRTRFDKLHKLGCICCKKAGSGYRAPDIHHVLRGGRRIGHQATLPLCPWHHRRVPLGGAHDYQYCVKVLGPSLADGSKPFNARWGNQLALLEEVDELIAALIA
jgi:hypothetical protein